jgi:two-component system phosphate regulon sensor histidine kinase PhoR
MSESLQPSPSTSDPPGRRQASRLATEWVPDFANSPIEATSLRWRLALPFIGVFLVILLLITLLLGFDARDRYVDQLADDLAEQARALAVGVGPDLATDADPGEIQQLLDTLDPVSPTRYTVIAADGVVLADSESDPATMANHAQRPEVIEARDGDVGREVRFSSTTNQEYMYVAVPMDDVPGGIVRAAMPMDSVESTVRGVWTTVILAGLVASALVFAIAWVLAGRTVRPLEELRQHAHALAGGDLSVRMAEPEVREIAEVSYAFNRMTEELERSQAAISEARLRLEAVLSELADGVVITDELGQVLKMNPAAETLLGATEATSVGKPFVQVCRDHELAAILRAALSGDELSEAAVEHGLNRRTLLTTAQVVQDGQDRLGLVVLRDISELRRLESVRRDFVANVSHELRTPLTSIRAMVETLEAGVIDDPVMTMDFLGRIVVETDRLTALVEDLLDLARLEAGRTSLSYERVDVPELLHDTADRLQTQLDKAHLEYRFETGGVQKPVRMDRQRMEQVLINLIHNAIKFTPPGGEITLRTYQTDEQTTIEVEDTGVGIEPEVQIRLFERFYKSDASRNSVGTGLGLAIVKHIVQSHGGTVSVQSAVGEGTTFRVVLPNRKPKARTRP